MDLGLQEEEDVFSDPSFFLPCPPSSQKKPAMKQNGHANGVMEKGDLKHVESPFFDASETMRSSTPAVMEQATPEKQGLGSLKLSASGGLKTSRLSQVSCAFATEAPDSEPNGSLAKPLNVSVTDAPGSQLSGKSLKASEMCNFNPGTPRKAKEMQAPSTLRVLKASIMDIVESFHDMIKWVRYIVGKFKRHEAVNVPLPRLVQFLLWAFAIVNLFMVKILKPKPWWLAVFVSQGMLLGLAASAWYYRNLRRKAEICGVLGSNLGLKGLNFLLGGLPSWLSFQEREKVQWLNRALEEVWPFYDAGLSKLIRSLAEEQFHNALKVQKIPGVRDIGFKHFTFGDVPFNVETIKVNDLHGGERALVMEVEMRWCGEANIALAIDLEPPFRQMCPGVEDVSFSGTLRIVLQPLVDDIPGFGAAMITFRKPPKFDYALCFGQNAFGEQIGAFIEPFIDGIIHNQLVNMLVWPQRLVIPILQTEQMEFEMEKLTFHARGIMKVNVIRAEKLPVADVVGTSDAFVELTTDGKHVVTTRFIPDSVNPEWNETHYLLVHDPTREHMKVEVYDHDAISPMDILKLNFKEVLDAKELLGRCLVNVKPITSNIDKTSKRRLPYEYWYDLGKGEWDKVGGCGRGRGRLQLSCLYRPFSDIPPLNPATGVSGILIFKIVQAHRLPRAVRMGLKMSVNAEVRCGKQRQIVATVTSEGDHKWNNLNTLDFHGIKSTSECSVVVQDKTTGDEVSVGSIDIKVQDVLRCQDLNPLSGKSEANFMVRSLKLKHLRSNPGHASGWITVRFRFVPYF